MSDRELINKCLWAFNPRDEQGVLVHTLVTRMEALLAANTRRASDEDGVRREIDDGPTVALLAWADMLTERGEEGVGEALRTLARAGQWPGRLGGKYRWAEPRFGGASWTLPQDVYQTLMMRHSGKDKGRFDSASEAILAAAKAWSDVEAKKQPPPEGHIRCPSCGVVKAVRKEKQTGVVLSCGKCEKVLGFIHSEQ